MLSCLGNLHFVLKRGVLRRLSEHRLRNRSILLAHRTATPLPYAHAIAGEHLDAAGHRRRSWPGHRRRSGRARGRGAGPRAGAGVPLPLAVPARAFDRQGLALPAPAVLALPVGGGPADARLRSARRRRARWRLGAGRRARRHRGASAAGAARPVRRRRRGPAAEAAGAGRRLRRAGAALLRRANVLRHRRPHGDDPAAARLQRPRPGLVTDRVGRPPSGRQRRAAGERGLADRPGAGDRPGVRDGAVRARPGEGVRRGAGDLPGGRAAAGGGQPRLRPARRRTRLAAALAADARKVAPGHPLAGAPSGRGHA